MAKYAIAISVLLIALPISVQALGSLTGFVPCLFKSFLKPTQCSTGNDGYVSVGLSARRNAEGEGIIIVQAHHRNWYIVPAPVNMESDVVKFVVEGAQASALEFVA